MEIRLTTAPEAYDGFGTETLEADVFVGLRAIWRRVAIRPEHLEWQVGRYLSGLYPCRSQADFDDLVADGLA